MTPRKVDPYVYVMEWIFRHSNAGGLTRAILLSIGRWMKWTPAGFETGPLSTKQIAEGAKVGDSTVREHLATLGGDKGDVEIIKSRRRGETYRYRLRREQLLPLADMRPNLHSRMAAVSQPHGSGELPPDRSGDTDALQRSDRHEPAVPPPNGGGVLGDVSFSSGSTCTSTATTTEEPAAAAFFEWFCAEYRTRRGLVYRVKREAALLQIAELLRDYPDARLRAMTLAMWEDRADSFLNDQVRKNDRGIFSLAHKATYLEDVVVHAGAPTTRSSDPWWWASCPHDTKCASFRECGDRINGTHQEAVG